jgi:hypothetical protein
MTWKISENAQVHVVPAPPGWWVLYRDDSPGAEEPVFGERVIAWLYSTEDYGVPLTTDSTGELAPEQGANVLAVVHEDNLPEGLLAKINKRLDLDFWLA